MNKNTKVFNTQRKNEMIKNEPTRKINRNKKLHNKRPNRNPRLPNRLRTPTPRRMPRHHLQTPKINQLHRPRTTHTIRSIHRKSNGGLIGWIK